jgi:metal-sulfur cluster biosynthetic enzyme
MALLVIRGSGSTNTLENPFRIRYLFASIHQKDHTMNEQAMSEITEERVYEALRECYDPELPVNLVDLGLIYDVKIIDDWVGVKMSLTSPGCGMSGIISQNVRDRLLRISGVKDADVRIVWQPAWTPAMMSEEAKKKLGFNA